jgi:hypothetical protein
MTDAELHRLYIEACGDDAPMTHARAVIGLRYLLAHEEDSAMRATIEHAMAALEAQARPTPREGLAVGRVVAALQRVRKVADNAALRGRGLGVNEYGRGLREAGTSVSVAVDAEIAALRAPAEAPQEAQAQREWEIRRLSRIASNHEAQWRYMVDEISRATGVDYDSPADAVEGVRALFALADDLKKQQISAALSPAGTAKEE